MLPSGSVQIRKEASAPVKTESMNVFSALHPIDDSSDHNGKINEDAAHTHEPLRGGMHSAGDKFSHTSTPQKSLICLSRQAAGIIFHILPRTIKSQGRSERTSRYHRKTSVSLFAFQSMLSYDAPSMEGDNSYGIRERRCSGTGSA